MAGSKTKKTIEITSELKKLAEEQIKKQQKETKYDLRDFTIDYIVSQFNEGLFFIPEYQREFIWLDQHRINFIESILLGLPIPMMFVADLEDGRLEIVDGAQRIQTLEQFTNDDLVLKELKLLPALNGFKYSDLPTAQQRKFATKALRLIVLEDSTSLGRRQEIFNRINTGAVKAKPSEVRRGSYESPLMKLVIKCSKDKQFEKLCPMSSALENRREREELVLRFFAYSDRYKQFRHDVQKFLDKYIEDNKSSIDVKAKEQEFKTMLQFVSRYFSSGFAKTPSAKSTPRVRFEAISVGVNLALRNDPNLIPGPMSWLESPEFFSHVTTHASNSRPKLTGRVEFVRDHLLGK
ncbi:DUF262 domain-containing protein [Agaribacterium haliotis]|uniref:DUF262 domain-containing protein n=1 Tax=Agaribacterium haliotis TaxID=2013869 RepID=UPI000BB5309B|nr:DUF262 domain-containing protein [Agaribacterium haliotis]